MLVACKTSFFFGIYGSFYSFQIAPFFIIDLEKGIPVGIEYDSSKMNLNSVCGT